METSPVSESTRPVSFPMISVFSRSASSPGDTTPPLSQARHDLADQRIVAAVKVAYRVLVRRLLATARCRMTVVDVSPEHVLNAIGRIEDAHHRAAPEAV